MDKLPAALKEHLQVQEEKGVIIMIYGWSEADRVRRGGDVVAQVIGCAGGWEWRCRRVMARASSAGRH